MVNSAWGSFCKRGTDVVGSSLLLILLSPVFLLVAGAVLLDSGRPVFFSQTRIGRSGRPFRCYKFRSMVAGAERSWAHLAQLAGRPGPTFKLRRDPRVTRTGRWLRRWSLDELPQLVNVLRGEMSLVGPRPPLPAEVEQYDPWHWGRLAVRPGLTGPWQIGGRADTGFDECVRLDLRYIEDWSLRGDLRILASTPMAVIRGGGAY